MNIEDLPRDARIPAIVPSRFWTEYEPDPAEPGKMIAVDWVEWVKVGDRSGAATQERISRLAPRRDKRTGKEVVAIEWAALGPKYEAWKRNEEIPVNGTPIEAWPGSTSHLVDALKRINVRSVEDFANAPRESFKGLPFPDLPGKQKAAKAFLEAAGDRAKIAAELETRDKTIESQGREIEELRKSITELAAAQKKDAA